MPDSLAIINRVIEEHQRIREHVKLVGDSVSDPEALRSLEKVRADWIPGRLEDVSEKQKRLQQTLSVLGEGLKRHFDFEEKALPPLLGELLMQSLIIDHRAIMKEIGEATPVVADTKLEGLNRDELIAKESHIQQMVNNICQLVEEHTTREETILFMVQTALKEKG